MSGDHFVATKNYEYDTAKAEALLKDEGWTKEGGKWYANGKQISFTLGAPSSSDLLH